MQKHTLSNHYKVKEHYEVWTSFRKHNKKQINIPLLKKYKVFLLIRRRRLALTSGRVKFILYLLQGRLLLKSIKQSGHQVAHADTMDNLNPIGQLWKQEAGAKNVPAFHAAISEHPCLNKTSIGP